VYNELYEIWKHELEGIELEKLPPDFYSKIADYIRSLKEESRMLDKRTVKARLLRSEVRNVKRMLGELTTTRYKKLLKRATEGDKASSDVLTAEEEKLLSGIAPMAEAYQTFAKGLLQGHLLQMDIVQGRRSVILRFLKDIQAIIGADMKSYGPFKAEDVASVPVENAKILIKQDLAEKVETS
jgi:DNA replication factor GINS